MTLKEVCIIDNNTRIRVCDIRSSRIQLGCIIRVFLFSDALTTPQPKQILYIMPCICVKNKTWSNMTQGQIIEYLTNELTLPKNSTSLSQYKLKSRSDPRQSSTMIGLVGSALICGVFGLLFITDIPALIRHLRAAITGQQELLWRNV